MAALVRNFWHAGYTNVISGGRVTGHRHYTAFRRLLPDAAVDVVQLRASKAVRDQVDGADYTYLDIDTSRLTVDQTVSRIGGALPEIYG